MLELKIVIAKVDSSLTESACKSIVEHFNENKQIPIKLFASTIEMGKVINLVYDEEKKIVVADVRLSIDFKTSGKILQDLETPNGKIILDCKLENVFMKILEE
jgi:hypothetical protein